MQGLPGLIGQLIEDARALARAEVRLAKSRAYALIRRSAMALALFGIAFMIAQAAIVALLLGLVLALVPAVGAVLAGVIILAGGLMIAGLLAWIGARILLAKLSSSPTEATP